MEKIKIPSNFLFICSVSIFQFTKQMLISSIQKFQFKFKMNYSKNELFLSVYRIHESVGSSHLAHPSNRDPRSAINYRCNSIKWKTRLGGQMANRRNPLEKIIFLHIDFWMQQIYYQIRSGTKLPEDIIFHILMLRQELFKLLYVENKKG